MNIVIATDDGCKKRMYEMTEEEFDKLTANETPFEYDWNFIPTLETITAEEL